MSLVNAFFITATFDGRRRALLTIDRKEFQIFVHEHIQHYPQLSLEIKQYLTTRTEFLNDLEKLTSEVGRGA